MLKNISLRMRFLLVVVGASALLLFTMSAIIFTSVSRTQNEIITTFNGALTNEKNSEGTLLKELIKQQVDTITGVIMSLAGTPIINFDYQGLDALIQVGKNQKEILYIIFYSVDGKNLTKLDDKNNNSVDEVIRKKISSDGRIVGDIEVGVSYTLIAKKISEINQRIEQTTMEQTQNGENKNNQLMGKLFFIAAGCLVLLSLIIYVMMTKSMIDPIQLFVTNLNQASTTVIEESKKLLDVSSQMANSSTEQASSLQEISSSLEELSGMVENNVKNAKNTQTQFNEVRDESMKGNAAMKDLVKSMNEIVLSTANIEQLVKVIGEIADKTKIIDEIVFQTKLLSFNASVEAERAGEHGRGFAVVAQEVGNLAMMSGKAAMEIATIVKSSIDNAKKITTDNKEKVNSGGELVKKAADALTKITDIAQLVSGRSAEIVSASQEQALGIKQINQAISELDEQSQKNTNLATQTAQSSGGLDQQAELLGKIVNEISSLVN